MREDEFKDLFFENLESWADGNDDTLLLKVGPNHGLYSLAIKLAWLIERFKDDGHDGFFTETLVENFHPEIVANRLVKIGQAMDALGCG